MNEQTELQSCEPEVKGSAEYPIRMTCIRVRFSGFPDLQS